MAQGTWGDGTKFKQEVTFSYALDNSLVIAKSLGFTNKEQTKYGPRNHGIRKYDAASQSLVFWEFDAFDGVTTGKIWFEGKNHYYQYVYGEQAITDGWEYVDDDTYNFRVGSFEDGKWNQIYLETQFIAIKQAYNFHYDHYSFLVKDLAKTGDFYKNVLQLEEIPHPSDTTNFKWFKLNGNSQLHLIRKDTVPMVHSKSMHLCLATTQLDELIDTLKMNNIPFSDWEGNANGVTLRADGVRQIYIQDPENNWVEINTAAHN
ncbi:MAG: hypothetical protein HKP38_06670 [Croceitalea sp.]|nr:VOC family protein [Croceitalea sp.]MBT8238707.1 VOC family protein [Croceitalea sp.]NNC34683.1 hypothetical protein [Croceitalea sp.]NNL08889.1 hypothetical protein [Croceitalea sp.]NNM17497.1 hypothetical protein [Croceitalea sp.]